MGIEGVGATTANNLSFSYSEPLTLAKASVEDLQSVPDIGPIVARNIFDWFAHPSNLNLIKKLLTLGLNLTNDNFSRNVFVSKLTGKTVVVTGRLSTTTRVEMKNKLQSMGIKVAGSVSKNTDFLLIGADAGSKLEKAEELGIKVITEDELDKLL